MVEKAVLQRLSREKEEEGHTALRAWSCQEGMSREEQQTEGGPEPCREFAELVEDDVESGPAERPDASVAEDHVVIASAQPSLLFFGSSSSLPTSRALAMDYTALCSRVTGVPRRCFCSCHWSHHRGRHISLPTSNRVWLPNGPSLSKLATFRSGGASPFSSRSSQSRLRVRGSLDSGRLA